MDNFHLKNFPNCRIQHRLCLLIVFFILQVTSLQEGNFTSASDNVKILLSPKELTSTIDYNKTFNLVCIRELNSKQNKLNFDVEFVFGGPNIIKLNPNLTLKLNESEQNRTIEVALQAITVGHTTLIANITPFNMVDASGAFIQISVRWSKNLDIFSNVVGWSYFVAWSVSFYPQTYLNWKRKSVIGLHFDFLALNTIGFFMYSVFNIGMYFIPHIENEYLKQHPFGLNPVQFNDVIFSTHAVFACLLQVFQCMIYEKAEQKISKTARSIISVIVISSTVLLVLSSITVITWLEYIYFLSYIKLFITLIKYIPQAYYNYVRKSTSGWSIGNVLLDFTGGILSICQMFILAYNYNDWTSLFGDATKFGLGLFSVLFDIFFVVQHYILYNNYQILEEEESLTDSEQSDNTQYGTIII